MRQIDLPRVTMDSDLLQGNLYPDPLSGHRRKLGLRRLYGEPSPYPRGSVSSLEDSHQALGEVEAMQGGKRSRRSHGENPSDRRHVSRCSEGGGSGGGHESFWSTETALKENQIRPERVGSSDDEAGPAASMMQAGRFYRASTEYRGSVKNSTGCEKMIL